MSNNIRNDEANRMYFVLRKFPELQNLALDCLHRPEDVVTGSGLNCKTKSNSILNLNNNRKKRLPAEFSLPLEDQCTRKILLPHVGSITSIPEVNEKMDNIRKSVLIERVNYRKSLAKERESFFPLSQIENKVIDPLESARAKLTKASLCFDSRSFINSLAGFQEGEPMNKEDVDIQLKRCLQINLSTEENDALFNSMDKDNSMYIDPVEFTRYFLSLGNIARDKSKQLIQINKKRKEDAIKKQIEDEVERQKKWEELSIASFVDNDKLTAMKKLRDAAFKWDSSVDTLTSAAFEANLKPWEFKRQLVKSFGLKLTPGEAGALIMIFSTRDDVYCIDGHKFMNKFVALREESHKSDIEYRKKFAKSKDRVRNMGQQQIGHTCLGR